MKRIAAIVVLAALTAAAPPAAGAASVQVLVVGKDRVLRGPKSVTLKPRTVKVGHRRCAVGAKTPLAVLAATRLRLGITDQGACSNDPRDAGGLYVRRVGPDKARGRSGWVYKVGNRAGTTGAADPSGPFGNGRRLHRGQRVLWFWCTLQSTGGCQRTLDARPDRTSVAPGEALRVTVRGYDDTGHGVPVEGATVTLGGATATTAADGVAMLVAPAAGHYRLNATRAGLVRSFPRQVAVG